MKCIALSSDVLITKHFMVTESVIFEEFSNVTDRFFHVFFISDLKILGETCTENIIY